MRINNNKEFPKFSVLMSVYKMENPVYLDEALKSIEKQTVLPTEIVLVEDGDIPAELAAIIKKHQRLFINSFKVVKSPRNQGLGNALRLGTNYITTNWIARMDSDDISVPNRFELQLKEIMQHPNLKLIGGQVKEFANKATNIVGYRRVPTTEKLILKFLKWRNPFNHPSVMINKKTLQKVGGYVPFGNLEDYYLWVRIIAAKYHVCNLDKTLVKMRVDEGLYNRRGKVSNIRYFFILRNIMYQNGLVKKNEKLIGDILMTMNIVVPNKVRKVIYQKLIHK